MSKYPTPRKWKPSNPEKYMGDSTNIIARSSWEIRVFNWCDTNSNIVRWNSEEIVIPYVSPIDGNRHRYFCDIFMHVKQSDGTIKKYLAEIKPACQTKPPVPSERKTKRYIQEAMTYAVNEAKWKAAIEVCKDNGIEFILLTEKEIGIK